MFGLVLFPFLVLFSCIGVFLLRKRLNQSLMSVLAKQQQLGRDLDDLSEKKKIMDSKISGLNKKLDYLLKIYDTTKELSKSLEHEQILEIFKERLRLSMGISDCKILPVDASGPEAAGYNLFPVAIEGKPVNFLAVRDSEGPDENLLALGLNQLALALRRANLYQEIQRISILDGLTGIYGRRYFMERADQEFARAKHHNLVFSLLMLDIDNFKSYNDTFGHLVGDMLLKKVSGILVLALRQVDMCARWGGEEFCVFLPDTPKDGAVMVAERLRLAVEQDEIKAYEEVMKITVSIGLATYPEDAKEYNALLDKADKALYKAKNLGRNRVFAYGMKSTF